MLIKNKIIKIFLIFILSFTNISFANNCNLQTTNINTNWETTFRANIRTLPCTGSSKILFVSKKSEIFKIVAKSDWWYKIELKNWKNAWIRDKAINIKNNYILTKADNLIIEKFSKAIEKIIKKNWEKSRKIFIEKLKKIWEKKALSPESSLPKREKGATKNNRIITIIEKIVEKLGKNIPHLNSPLLVKRGETAKEVKKKIEKKEEKKIIKKIEKKEIDFKTNSSLKANENDIINYDFEKVKKTWINWHNIERKKLGLPIYTEKNKLDISATNWSVYNRNHKKIDHRRHTWDAYYDYKKVTKWMKDNWVVCKNIYRVTYSESIARDWITCNKADCTDEVIKWLREAFDYFMNEKWIPWIAWAHYRAIVHKTFRQIGFWIATEKIWKNSYRIYSTSHYCTEVQ